MIESKSEVFTKENLKCIGIESVSMNDVLNCFPSQGNSNNESFYNRILQKEESWWSDFFEYLSKHMTEELASTMFSKPIFILNHSEPRQYIPWNIAERRALLCTSDDQSIRMWKKNYTLVFYKSKSEQQALLRTNEVVLLTDDKLIELILLEHLNMATSRTQHQLDDQSRKELWQDLDFLRSRTDRFDCSKPLMIPVQDSNVPSLVCEASLPTVVGFDIRKFVLPQSYPLVELPSNNLRLKSLLDLLQWEKFLLTAQCRSPLIELNNYSIKDLPILNILEKCHTTEYAEIGEFILSKQVHKTREVLSQFPILANISDRLEIFPISATFDKLLLKNSRCLPWINIQRASRTLARMLGVRLEYDLQTCITILNIIAHKGETDIQLYLTCLRRLQLEVHNDDADIDLDTLQMSCRLYLPDKSQFSPLTELLILSKYDDKYFDVVKQCCKYLDLKIISANENQVYWEFKELFFILKCKSFLTIKDVCLAISRASRDERNFFAIGDGNTVLNNAGRELMINLFEYLEFVLLETTKKVVSDSLWYQLVINSRNDKACTGSREDLEWRFKLLEAANSDNLEIINEIKEAKIPILTIRNELIERVNGSIIYSCFEERIIQHSIPLCRSIHFVAPIILCSCPLVLAMCGVDYIERVGEIIWLHKDNDQERIHNELTKIFQRVMGDRNIEVVSVPYGFMRPILPLELVSNNQLKEQSRSQIRIQNSFWIIKNTVLLCIGHAKQDQLTMDLAVSALAILLHHRKYIPYQDAKTTARYEVSICRSFQHNGIWPLASSSEAVHRYVEVIFPIDRPSYERVGIPHINSRVMLSNSDPEQNGLIAADMLEIDESYRSRVVHINHKSIQKIPRDMPYDYYVIDQQKNFLIGHNAEHFFFSYLKQQYRPFRIIPIESWVSSARLKVYPTYKHDINDAAGYDFILEDTKELFAKGEGGTTKTCYFEIKGTSGVYNPNTTRFNISRNEYNFCSKIYNNDDRRRSEAYFVVIIEHCLDKDKIDIGKIICWYVETSISLH